MEAEKIETESNALSMRASEIIIATQKRQGHENTQKIEGDVRTMGRKKIEPEVSAALLVQKPEGIADEKPATEPTNSYTVSTMFPGRFDESKLTKQQRRRYRQLIQDAGINSREIEGVKEKKREVMAPFESELKRLKKEQKELFNTIEAFEYPNTPIFDSISDRPQRNCKERKDNRC